MSSSRSSKGSTHPIYPRAHTQKLDRGIEIAFKNTQFVTQRNLPLLPSTPSHWQALALYYRLLVGCFSDTKHKTRARPVSNFSLSHSSLLRFNCQLLLGSRTFRDRNLIWFFPQFNLYMKLKSGETWCAQRRLLLLQKNVATDYWPSDWDWMEWRWRRRRHDTGVGRTDWFGFDKTPHTQSDSAVVAASTPDPPPI